MASSSPHGGAGDPDSSVRSFVERQRRLLDLELRSDLEEEESARAGAEGISADAASPSPSTRSNALRGLSVEDASTGLYGRTVVTLVLRCGGASCSGVGGDADDAVADAGTKRAGGLLPAHRLTVGDEVEILGKGRKPPGGRRQPPGGVICAVTESAISVALFDGANRGRGRNGGSSAPPSKFGDGKKGGKAGPPERLDNDGNGDGDDEIVPGLSPPLTLIPRSSAEVHRKMKSALDNLAREGVGHPVSGRVIQAAFTALPLATDPKVGGRAGRADASHTQEEVEGKEEEPLDPTLDATQRSAVAFALGSPSSSSACSRSHHVNDRPISLIHGPPGTGKTTAVVELIRRAVLVRGWRVLVCAPSNVAVDNVLEKLVAKESGEEGGVRKRGKRTPAGKRAKTVRLVRLGHPARLRPAILPHSLEHLVRAADGTEIVRDVRRELDSYIKVLSNPKARGSDRRIARREAKALRAEVRRREEGVVREVLGSANVVLCTCVGAGSSALNKLARTAAASPSSAYSGGPGNDSGHFDLVVIDEAAQALEASCWIPALRGSRLVLAGDHKQLPPTVMCRSGEVRNGLGRTMFERIMGLYGDDSSKGTDVEGRVSRMLRVQYRMHSDIADWSSGAMYGGSIVSHESVKSRRLIDHPDFGMNKSGDKEQGDSNHDGAPGPLLLIDTAGCSHHETQTPSLSRLNHGEAALVANHVRSLLSSGLSPSDVAVISPYNGQVELLRNMLLPSNPGLEIRSVDGFQGGEREAVVMSLVRSSDLSGSNRGGKVHADTVGFLRDDRRLNVAVTRAKRHCCIVCDSETVSKGSEFLGGMVRWFEDHGEVRSAAEYDVDLVDSGAKDGGGGAAPCAAKGHMFQGVPAAKKASEEEVAKLVDEVKRASLEAAPTTRPLHTGGGSVLQDTGTVTLKNASATTTTTSSSSEDARRKALMDKISAFAESPDGHRGRELTVGANLSKYDRLVVQELAVQLGLGYRTVGSEGINQRVVVTLLRERIGSSGEVVKNDGDDGRENEKAISEGFAAFALVGGESSDEDEVTGDAEGASVRSTPSADNTLLADLARERMERQHNQSCDKARTEVSTGGKKNKKKKKKSSGKKGGGRQQAPAAVAASMDHHSDNTADIDDDMAFLDAQIEVAQNSHGRKVEGSGKGYKYIVNGILNARPPLREEKKDERAGAALKAKLKKAEEERRAKGGSGKRKKKR